MTFNTSRILTIVALLAGLGLSAMQPLAAQAAPSRSPAPGVAQEPAQLDAATEARVEAALGQLPLYFVENQGQTDGRVAYYVQGRDKTLYFTAGGVTMALTGPVDGDRGSRQRYTIRLEFVGADPRVRPVGRERTEAVFSYFKGSADEWQAGLPAYASVVYRDLWPGIDLIYRGDSSRLKYSLLVQPWADPSQIQLAYDGASSVTLDGGGRLAVSTPVGGFQDERPVAYQEVNGQRVEVEAAYALDAEAQRYGLQVGTYDPGRQLVIDPAVLVYAGYIGGSGDDSGSAIAVDGTGNAYVTGGTYSTEAQGFPVTVGPDLTFNGSRDAFVAKVKPDGSGLVYCGYIGGSQSDSGSSIAVDGMGNAYVAGTTYSTEAEGFPVTVGPDTTFNGSRDAFVAKVKADGSGLDYCGYIGGSDYEYGYDIAVDGVGTAYVTGETSSTEAEGFPVAGALDPTHNGSLDAFVAKVRADGSGLVYAGYIGGSGSDYGRGITVDGVGSAYVTGETRSTEAEGFPVAGALDPTHNGSLDAFVAKLRADGSGLVYAGYIGGSGSDCGRGITVDGVGRAYVTGETRSTEAEGFPVRVGPDLTYGVGSTYVARVKTDGSGLDYCGYIEGTYSSRGIAVDTAGNAYVTGFAWPSEAFPGVVGPDVTYNGGMADAFLAKVKADGSGLVYAGYIGGCGEDVGHGVAVDDFGNAFVTGVTQGCGFPVRVGPDLTHNGGHNYYDAFVARIPRVPESVPEARAGGYIIHDDDGDGLLNAKCRASAAILPGCEPGLDNARASIDSLSCTTKTSGWYSFDLLVPGTYQVMAAPPPGSWWTPTTPETCEATVTSTQGQILCNFGYWWGLDGPQVSVLVAQQEMTLAPVQDAAISSWEPGSHGFKQNLWIRQPGVESTLVQFDLSGLPAGAQIVTAKLRLYTSMASNDTNRLYMTAYPVSKPWTEGGAAWSEAAAGLPWEEAGATGASDHTDPVGWAWTNTLGWVEFDLDPAVVAEWLDTPSSNNGLLLRGEGSINRKVAYWFLSREHGNAAVQPQLVIGYDLA